MTDKHGREIRPGDVLRLFHYMDAMTKRNVYMHKLVEQCLGGLYCVDVVDIARHGFDNAHRCRLSCLVSSETEIIDGIDRKLPDGGIETWYERPRQREASK